jgi:hypothetical protein
VVSFFSSNPRAGTKVTTVEQYTAAGAIPSQIPILNSGATIQSTSFLIANPIAPL